MHAHIQRRDPDVVGTSAGITAQTNITGVNKQPVEYSRVSVSIFRLFLLSYSFSFSFFILINIR